MAVRHARDMPEARRRLVRWLGDPDAEIPATEVYRASRREAMPEHLHDTTRTEAVAGYVDWVRRTAAGASLYWVSDDLTDVAEQAATTLPVVTVAYDLLPSDMGLLCWSRPISGSGSPVMGILWRAVGGRLWIQTLQDPTVLRTALPIGWLGPDEEWWIALDAPVHIETRGTSRGLASLAMIATWLLMSQTITEVAQVRPATAERRRLARQGDPDPVVQYVALRHRTVVGTPEQRGDREYRHRWIVRGHWRRQWYPSAQTHRPLWIAPHLAGPEDAPLLRREQVFTLRR